MGFLSGVLNEVKNDPSVTTYYTKMETTLKTIKSSMHKSDVLSKAVEAVSQALGEWDGEVTEKTSALKKTLTDLKSNNIDAFHKSLNDLNELSGEQLSHVADRLGNCFTQAAQLEKALEFTDDAYRNLDSTLRDKLKDPLNNIMLQVKQFVASGSNTELRASVDMAKDRLDELRTDVDDKVTKHVGVLGDMLRNKFENDIQDPITQVKKDLETAKSNLDTWINKAKEVVQIAQKKVDEIVKMLEGNEEQTEVEMRKNTPKKKTAVANAAKKLQDDANNLWEAVRSAKEGLSGLSGSITAAVDKLEKVYKATLKDLQSTVQGKVSAAQGVLKQLGSKVQQDLEGTIKNHIKKEIDKVITKFQEGIVKVTQLGAYGANQYTQEFWIGLGDIRSETENLAAWANEAKNRGSSFNSALEKFNNGNGKFENFKNLLTQLTVNNASGKNFFEAINADLEAKLGGAIKDITRDIPGKMTQYSAYAKTGGGAIHNAIEVIKTDVDGYFGEANGSGDINETKLNEKGYKKSGGGAKELLDNEIGRVQTNREKLEDAKTSDNVTSFHEDTFTAQFKTFQQSLTTFTDSVKALVKDGKNNNDVHAYLEELNRIIESDNGDVNLTANGLSGSIQGLAKIKTDIEKILGGVSTSNPNNLKKILENATAFDDYIRTSAFSCINALKKDVEAEVGRVTRAIQDTAKRQYYTKMSEMLDKMKRTVDIQVRNIGEAIDKDLRTGVKGFMRTFNGNINKMNTLKNQRELRLACPELRAFLDELLNYAANDIKRLFKTLPTDPPRDPYSRQLCNVIRQLLQLLDGLHESNHFDHNFTTNLEKVIISVNGMAPNTFVNEHDPLLLDVLKGGLNGLIEQLSKAYVNTYSGQTFEDNLLDGKTVVDVGREPTAKYDLNNYGRKCSKVFLTLLRRLHDDMNELYEMCKHGGNCYRRKIYASVDENANHLGDHLKTCGYRVASGQDCQDGELRCSPKMMGWRISRDILTRNDLVKIEDELEDEVSKTKHSILKKLYDNLHDYYEVCQLPIPSSKKLPSSVYQILLWFAGLTYNPVFRDLSLHGFDDLFEKPENADADQPVVQGISFQDGNADALEAHPHRVTAAQISGTLTAVCHDAEATLIALLGYGHAEGRYACDFNTNAEKLHYPSKPSDCIDMLMELANRAYHQLCFLCVQCERTYDSTSWRECYYGRGIGGSSWECNAIQCPNQKGGQDTNQKGDQTCNQMGNQMADQNCRCGIKSPLQSFLEDGLPGFMAHSFIKPGCKLTCAAPNHVGKPCKTPMGFTDISVTGSHTKTGAHLARILKDFCGKPNAPLALLCSYLTCVLQQTPQTLDDLFSFFYNMIKDWKTNGTRKLHKYDAFEDAVTKANFGVRYPELDINPLFQSSKHSHGSHVKGDLFSLYTCDTDARTAISCGRYLQPVGINTWIIFSNKNAEKYLSWVVYLTETFYDLLKKLYDDCCEKCNKPGTRCHDTSCVKKCTTSLETTTSTAHEEGCRSIARCPYTRPTLYKYGFVFQSPYNLSGANEVTTKRTCKDFCRTLQRVLDKNSVLIELRQKIDAFLWTIRTPFSYLVLTLWLLSLLYLIHIMVIRLDLLHIKSHLHSPSSHRIAAQSLLAAGRVSKLNRVFYLQP